MPMDNTAAQTTMAFMEVPLGSKWSGLWIRIRDRPPRDQSPSSASGSQQFACQTPGPRRRAGFLVDEAGLANASPVLACHFATRSRKRYAAQGHLAICTNALPFFFRSNLR